MQFIRENLRSLTMVFVLVLVWLFFSILTDGVFLEARNISNLFRQMAVISFLSIGMVFIIVSGHIDLSVGSLVGFTGAIAAMIQVKWLGPWLFDSFETTDPFILGLGLSIAAIGLTLLSGLAIGLIQGLCVALGGVPSFIVTLAGMLIFKGLILGVTNGRTIGPVEPEFKLLGQSYLPPQWGWVLAIVLGILIIITSFRRRQKATAYGLPIKSKSIFSFLLTLSVTSIFGLVLVLNAYKGIPVPFIMLILIACLMTFVGQNTTFGRYVYAIGDNKEAAALSGINIPKVLLINFAIMGVLASISGMVLTARLDAATTNAGNMFELSAIAACVIGGCSLAGGSGSIAGALIGALMMASLDNGMSLMNVEIFWQQIIKGLVLLFAVWMDVYGRSSNRSIVAKGTA